VCTAAEGQLEPLFADTKEQNGCARVGQVKLFPSNYTVFAQQAKLLQQHWQQLAQTLCSHQSTVDLHLQMISTVAGSEDVFARTAREHEHSDELWIWIPFTEASVQHLKGFLHAFSATELATRNSFSAVFHGERASAYAEIFAESFRSLEQQEVHQKSPLSMAVLTFKAGLLNSRKAMISPYLPTLVR
jgi:hypothetical protein